MNQQTGHQMVTADKDAAKNAEKMFRAEFKSEPATINAGTSANLIFTIKDQANKSVQDLQIVHEKPMHLLVVSRDLAEFYHLHPEPLGDGSYAVAHVFPNGGEYRLYADFTLKDAAQVVEQVDIKVSGAERAKVALQPDTKFEKNVGGLRVAMKTVGELKAGNELMLEFAAFDEKTNKPATDLQNYLGELAHFVIISEDMKDFVHAHPMSKSKHNSMNKMVADDHNDDGHTHGTEKTEIVKASESEVAAHTAFPRSGLYKVWAQFQRGGQVITVPYVISVS